MYDTGLTENFRAVLKKSRVFVAGCGGLGGYVIEYLLRLGLGEIVAADGDSFGEENLCRQLLCTSETLGMNKVQAAAERAALIAPDCKFTAVPEFIDEGNCYALLEDCCLAIDALDNNKARLILAAACRARGIYLIHGAVSGYAAQIAAFPPESSAAEALFSVSATSNPAPAHIPPLCAALEVNEALEVLAGLVTAFNNELLSVDLKSLDVNKTELM